MRKTIYTALAAAAATFVISSPASAKVDSLDCSAVTFSVATIDCLGFYAGNLTAESGPKFDEAISYTIQLDPNATFIADKIEWGEDQNANPIDFNIPLSGPTVIGIHFGGGRDGFNGTGFWLLDFPNDTDTFTWSSTVQSGISNAAIYGGGVVPEPATWAMLIAGFGLTGAAMRRRKTRVAVTYA